MSTAASIESGTLAPDVREALRTLLSRKSEPYLEFPSTVDAPGVCICTSYADLRRTIEAAYQAKLNSRPTVPVNYSVGGGRRKLPDATRRYVEVGTQTEARPVPVAPTSQIESASESGPRRPRRLRRAPVSRPICSSTDTESAGVSGAGSVRGPG
jgi:hypothetical protein